MGVGILSPPFDFKDFHHTARLQFPVGDYPGGWSPALWCGEASRVAASLPPSASRMFIILAVVGGRLSRGPTLHLGW
jgi:hypothetical protein